MAIQWRIIFVFLLTIYEMHIQLTHEYSLEILLMVIKRILKGSGVAFKALSLSVCNTITIVTINNFFGFYVTIGILLLANLVCLAYISGLSANE
jgi:hypothetical protein